MKKLFAIGEALIDFISGDIDCEIKNSSYFKPIVGGAPTNVCGAFAKLGGNSAIITQLGKDAFGDKIEEELKHYGIDTSYILRTDKANTCLAFVSLKADGQRDFSFYRKPSADMLLNEKDINENWFKDCGVFHFCSVSLGEYPMKYAHKKAIDFAVKNNSIISFDPNIRLSLWEDYEQLKKVIWEFIPYAHVLKISDEELKFITGYDSIEDALDLLFTGNVKLIIYTMGADGAKAYTKNDNVYSEGVKTDVVDTTGAGDAFIGSFLFQIVNDNINNIDDINMENLKRYLDFSNMYCSFSVQKNGAIKSYATFEQINKLI